MPTECYELSVERIETRENEKTGNASPSLASPRRGLQIDAPPFDAKWGGSSGSLSGSPYHAPPFQGRRDLAR